MKILMLGWELPPHNSGGLGVACYQMCKHLARRGVEIDFVVPYRAKHENIDFMKIRSAIPVDVSKIQFFGAYDSHCYTCDSEVCDHAVPGDLRAQQQRYTKYVEQLVKKEKPDVIHAHDWLTFEAGMVAQRVAQKPLIAHVHATEFDRSGEHHGNPLVHDIEYNGLLMADRIIAVSNITKNIIVKEYNIPADKVEVVHNSIDDEELIDEIEAANSYVYLEQMKRLGYKVVVTVGRLTVQKGYRYLLEAAQKVAEKNEKVLFLIAGSGELRDELIQLSADLGVADKILFTGFVRGKQWRDVYSIGDMFVMSSVSEPFGLTALEAASKGTALLLSKQSGVGEVLHNVMRFDYWDTHKLADQIVNIADHPNLQAELKDNMLREFNELSWTQAVDRYMDLYTQVHNQGVPA